MKKILIAVAALSLLAAPAFAAPRGGHSGAHNYQGGNHQGYRGGYRHGANYNYWIPGAIIGGAILGGAVYDNTCWQWVETAYGLQKQYICD